LAINAGLAGALLALGACSGSTGSEVVSFHAAAIGAQAADGGTLAFDNNAGFHVVLERARLHVGAMYLNASVPSSGAQATSCTLPGLYVGEVLDALDVDMLSSERQRFPGSGEGTATQARVAEFWLSGGAVDAVHDDTAILDAKGTAERDGDTFPFEARISIGDNRAVASSDPAFPGRNPICKQRIVTPILVSFTPTDGGTLLLRVDPRALFRNVDFSTLPRTSSDPPLYSFTDGAATAADVSLYGALRSTSAVYELTWEE
jgi:hypothetical protein